MSLIESLVHLQRRPIVGALARGSLLVLGVDVPSEVRLGREFTLAHRGQGVVIHPRTIIGDRVTIYHGVTFGRARPWLPSHDLWFHIEDDVIIAANAVILNQHGRLTIGRGAVIGANAVVSRSVPPGEVWAGSPARKVGERSTAQLAS